MLKYCAPLTNLCPEPAAPIFAMTALTPATPPQPLSPSLPLIVRQCLALDLEVGISDQRIHHLALVRGDDGSSMVRKRGQLQAAFDACSSFAAGARFLLGHNLIDFDLPYLRAEAGNLPLLDLPLIDTLYLNPLAFPRNPYHHLVKHYPDAHLVRGTVNDPELDCRLSLQLLADQWQALLIQNTRQPQLLLVWHWLCGRQAPGFDALFCAVRQQTCPSATEAAQALISLLSDITCSTARNRLLEEWPQQSWPLAYALAWLSVAGDNSVLAPWVGKRFAAAPFLIRALRDTPCNQSTCTWCQQHHNARRELQRWFNFPDFRPTPVDADGTPLQQKIVEAAMAGRHLLGILPTGTGKSLCYQVPALSRFEKTGALTVVVSPLVALMADQVANLEGRGITCATSINGLLSMPERKDALDKIRLGDIGILLIAPEQLRAPSVRKVLAQREIGMWVLDEAHCLSKWGHDFRPDYRYVGRFMRERAGEEKLPPVLCLTATAKPDVVSDILAYFKERSGIELQVLDGGTRRENLDFVIIPSSSAEKFARIAQLLEHDLVRDSGQDGAIVYCASRRKTEEVAAYLREVGWAAEHFHAGLSPERKKSTQQRFISGELRVIAATNAFGMGIDKPDVRLVIHADMPGSLENYLQEAGRAGRDQGQARCVLLYNPDDVEWQFGMSARQRLTRDEIAAILRSIKILDKKNRKQEDGVVIATSNEMLAQENEGRFARDSHSDDTRVRTAIAWLEEARLLTREENSVQVFPSSLRIRSMQEAEHKLNAHPALFAERRQQLLALVRSLLQADTDQGISTDELMHHTGMNGNQVRAALYDLEQLGIASNDTNITAYVHVAVARSSQQRLQQACALEVALIDLMREQAPDLQKGEHAPLHLRVCSARLKQEGHTDAIPERLWRILQGLAQDGRNQDSGNGSLSLKRLDAESLCVTLQRKWQDLSQTAELRRAAAQVLLTHWLSCLPPGSRGVDLLASSTQGGLLQALRNDLHINNTSRDPAKLLERALLWLHEQEVLRLNKGLMVFRPAMTIHLSGEKQGFRKHDYAPLQIHYQEQVVQIHVMAEYIQRGLQVLEDALKLALDYFSMERSQFLQRWLPGKESLLQRQTTPASWSSIVENLGNDKQQAIVTEDKEPLNMLVLAGPGSGKTRVLVHRIGYLLRVKRIPRQNILVLTYNRHAALEIRQRLAQLIGEDGQGVLVMTCHALAMRLVGASFSASFSAKNLEHDLLFSQVLREATALLQGDSLEADDADLQRQRLLGRFRYIFVDEYQDIGPDQYALISALAGRSLQDAEQKLNLFAVGDDDQNIYGFDGASVEYIRRFERDYAAKPVYLLENFRSSANIIAVSNALIQAAHVRMKAGQAIEIARSKAGQAAGGVWQERDPVAQGRVQILNVGANQAGPVLQQLQRLAALDPAWNWARVAVIARNWKTLRPLYWLCEQAGIPAQMGDDAGLPFWRVREVQSLLSWLQEQGQHLIDAERIKARLAGRPGPWQQLLREAIEAWALESENQALPAALCSEWLYEWGREARTRQSGLLLTTAHRAKGLEFDHVAILDGDWLRKHPDEDQDAPRRLLYVAMTRARHTLLLARRAGQASLLDGALTNHPSCLYRESGPGWPEQYNEILRLGLKEVDLGMAGRVPLAHPIHQALANLQAGDPLQCRLEGTRLLLCNQEGMQVGKTAASWQLEAGWHCVQARVWALIRWRRADTPPEYLPHVQAEEWWVVLPELIVSRAPAAPAPGANPA